MLFGTQYACVEVPAVEEIIEFEVLGVGDMVEVDPGDPGSEESCDFFVVEFERAIGRGREVAILYNICYHILMVIHVERKL